VLVLVLGIGVLILGYIKVGDELVAVGGLVVVTQVSTRSDKVTYVLTDNDALLIHALIAPTQSTMAGGAQFTCFTGTRVQILAQKAVLERRRRAPALHPARLLVQKYLLTSTTFTEVLAY
jgi:hypothetical protein